MATPERPAPETQIEHAERPCATPLCDAIFAAASARGEQLGHALDGHVDTARTELQARSAVIEGGDETAAALC